jgi:hypothetical protein
MSEEEQKCCEGNDRDEHRCLKSRCPIYEECRRAIDSKWPYVGTGFGNLYGNPSHGTYLARVREFSKRRK